MKKVFTSVCLAIMALLVMTPAMAQQTQLTDQEKAVVVKELLPVMLDQVKEISGINFLPIDASLTIEDIITSPLFTPVVSLRAEENVITYKPDSMRLDLSKIPGIPALMATMLSDIKLTFDNYTTYKSGNNVIEIPGKVVSTMNGMEAMTLNIIVGKQTGFLPFSSLAVDFTVAPALEGLLGKGGKLVTFTETTASAGAYNYNLVFEQGLKDLLGMFTEISLTNMLIKTDMSALETKGTIDASLYSLPSATTQVSMGDAKMYVNKAMQADSILLTSYDYATGAAVLGYRKLVPTLAQKDNKDWVITNQDSSRVSTTAAWAWQATQTVTMSNSAASTSTDIISAIQQALTTLLKGESVNLKMVVDTIGGTNTTPFTIFKTEVTSAMGGTSQDPAVVANISMSSLDEETKVLAESMKIKITLPTKSETIKIEFSPVVDGTASLMATAYMKSDLMSGGTPPDSNEAIENEVKIALTEGGFWVSNIENGTYTIVNMRGAVVAKGRITSSDSFVSTGSIARGGAYIFVVNEKGTQQSVKFINK